MKTIVQSMATAMTQIMFLLALAAVKLVVLLLNFLIPALAIIADSLFRVIGLFARVFLKSKLECLTVRGNLTTLHYKRNCCVCGSGMILD